MDQEESRKTESLIKVNQEAWESSRIKKRAEDMKRDLDRTGRLGQKSKNPRDFQEPKTPQGRARKKMKYQLMEDDWGEAPREKVPGRENAVGDKENQEARAPKEKEPWSCASPTFLIQVHSKLARTPWRRD